MEQVQNLASEIHLYFYSAKNLIKSDSKDIYNIRKDLYFK